MQHFEESVFLAFQILGGHVLLPLLLAVIFFSKKVLRHPVSVNFILSFILSSIFYSLWYVVLVNLTSCIAVTPAIIVSIVIEAIQFL